MTRSVLVTFLVALALSLTTPAQSRPDFSGTWTMDLARSESPTYPDFVGPVTLVISQTPAELRIETRRGSPPGTSTAIYQIREVRDAPRTVAREGGPGSPIAYWDGTALVTEGVLSVQGKTVQTRERRTLDVAAAEMRVESILIVEHGYSLRGTKNYGKADDVFKRVP